MAEVEYLVSTVLEADPSRFIRGMREAVSASDMAYDKISTGLTRLGGGIFGFAASAVSGIAKTGALLGGAVATGFGAAALGVGSVLSELESKTIQMAAVTAAATQVSFSTAVSSVQKLVERFRIAAVESAGETKDFIQVASLIAGPLYGAGKSAEDLFQITKGVIATAPALGTSFEQAGADVMRMLQGNAGVELPFFRAMMSIPTLGIQSAAVWNKLPVEQRIKKIQAALTNPAFQAAAKAYGDSFQGVKSTILDAIKFIGSQLGGPLFETVKRGAQSIAQTLVNIISNEQLKSKLALTGEYFQKGLRAILYPWTKSFASLDLTLNNIIDKLPDLVASGMEMAANISSRIKDAWDFVYGRVSAISDKLQAIKSPKLFQESEESGVSMKAIGGALGGSLLAARALTLAPTVIGGISSFFGGASAATAATAATGATAAAAAGGGGILATLTGALPIIAAIGAAIYSMIGAFESNIWGVADYLSSAWNKVTDSLGGLWTALGQLWDAGGKLLQILRPVTDVIGGVLLGALALWLEQMSFVIDQITLLVSALSKIPDAIEYVINAISAKLGITGLKETAIVPERKAEQIFMDVSSLNLEPQKVIEKPKASQKGPQSGGKQQVEVKIKLDTGPNEDAIFVRSGRHLREAIERAEITSRMMRQEPRGTRL